jgi:hypothetical protein
MGHSMKTILRRAISIAEEIESFKWAGFPGDDPDGVYAPINHLRSLAIRLRAAAQILDHPYLREALERLQINIDGNDFDAGVALHAELLGCAGWLCDVVEKCGDDPSRWPAQPGALADRPTGSKDEKSLPTKERVSLLKLVIGMAIKGYRYDPSAAKSTVPGEIASDLAELGLTIDVGTVRKYLTEGRDLVPSNFNKHDS